MKLYTEEQVSNLIQAIYPQISREEFCKLIQAFVPIELPSEEEIKHTSELNLVEPYASYWRTGAKWVIEKLKQQENGKISF